MGLEYNEVVWRPYGIDDALRVWLPAPPGHARSVYLERSRKNYTKRERNLLALVRPHLERMRVNAESRRRIASGRGLTPREAEVLGWVARGKTNVEIGAALFRESRRNWWLGWRPARKANRSWSEIGAMLGAKQAAQRKYASKVDS